MKRREDGVDQITISCTARMLAARRRLVAGRCAACGQPFMGTSYRKYCSIRCKNRVSMRRQRAAKKEG